MNLTLSAVYEEVPESEGGGYVAYTEELPGAISEGETLDEARENLRNPSAQLTSTVPRHREVKNPTAVRLCKQLAVPDPTALSFNGKPSLSASRSAIRR